MSQPASTGSSDPFEAPAPGAAPPVASSYQRPAPTGPLGKPRSFGVSILLAIVTVGIYAYVWTYKTEKEIKEHSGAGLGGGLALLLFFVFSPVMYFLIPNDVKEMLTAAGRPSRVSAITGLWVLLPLAGSIVWFVKVQGQLNEYWESLGAHRP